MLNLVVIYIVSTLKTAELQKKSVHILSLKNL